MWKTENTPATGPKLALTRWGLYAKFSKNKYWLGRKSSWAPQRDLCRGSCLLSINPNEPPKEGRMKTQGSYVPPQYIPLHQEDNEFESNGADVRQPSHHPVSQPDPIQWSSGICACCDDMQSCCIGGFCPCFLFGKNAEFLGSGTLAGSCMTHFVLWGLVNSLCCLCTGGILFGLPGSVVACYAGGYRRALRAKYNLQEAPCGDFTTHVCCHLCAICQEYREIRESTLDPLSECHSFRWQLIAASDGTSYINSSCLPQQ
ncbi:hypothetical protein J5N97_013026 [Dioscorea zingiberensis]|uniref:Uncharacterized protein n=1 Tax=Dioscorea zingiberensis TaxID=325984 RepID=A0A9D5HIP0_9LILI|nr:hypothetical protein J5N97_013026 [Dioscorea zingiberensis]